MEGAFAHYDKHNTPENIATTRQKFIQEPWKNLYETFQTELISGKVNHDTDITKNKTHVKQATVKALTKFFEKSGHKNTLDRLKKLGDNVDEQYRFLVDTYDSQILKYQNGQEQYGMAKSLKSIIESALEADSYKATLLIDDLSEARHSHELGIAQGVVNRKAWKYLQNVEKADLDKYVEGLAGKYNHEITHFGKFSQHSDQRLVGIRNYLVRGDEIKGGAKGAYLKKLALPKKED